MNLSSGNNISHRLSNNRYTPVAVIVLVVVVISFITRLTLLLTAAAGFSWTFTNIAGTFIIGLLFDLAMASYFIIPLILLLWFRNDRIYNRKVALFITSIFAAVLLLLIFTGIIPEDFNAPLRTAILLYLLLRFIIYLALLFAGEKFRIKWRIAILYIYCFLAIFFLCFNAVSEWFFWNEFSTRYNFIAVDYLVYTSEVIGNIRESYPIVTIVLIVFAISVMLFFVVRPAIKRSVRAVSGFRSRTLTAIVLLAIPVITFYGVNEKWRNFSDNEYANQLAGNGIFQFGNAFWENNLDFFKFYKTLPDKEAFNIVRESLQEPGVTFFNNDIYDIRRSINYPGAEKKYNVVLISVESLSAAFMRHFGSDKNITPYLDSLAEKSIFFTRLYASGTRTVRGLEALSLAIPPTPGQSIVKRPKNENLFSLASVFNKKGYASQFIYGGYSYFDNMGYFFSHNGYEVIDRDAIDPSKIHYQNVWGVADEDLFTLALQTMDKNHSAGKLFFTQVMTVSNHRPYTYPADRIDIAPETQSREGAVKYTDFAINKFLIEASHKPWFDSTIFVIVADHCAAAAGSVELPVPGYHIPMLIYAPAILQPVVFNKLTAQIDIAPSILGLLNMNYTSKFMGQDIFKIAEDKTRAFISTYQGLGYLTNSELIIQKPVRQVTQYVPNFNTGAVLPKSQDSNAVKKALAFYQVASWLIKNGRYNSE